MRRLEDKPEISIIIPTYNHAHFLKRCLESVIAQTFINWEVIVVNNYSEDNTIEVVNSFADPRVHLVNFHNNGIIAASRNEGIRQSSGNLIAFLDSDDWWYPNKLEIAAKYLTNTDIVYHDLDIFTNKGKRLIKRIRSAHLKKPVFIDLMKNSNVLANSSVVVRKSIIDKVGGLTEDKRFFAAEDFDLWLKISRVTDRFLYIPKSLGAYWIG
ncbi:MAG TPA: glycosyltransferase, partial [bacterium]|nr:glycosyltransferase [bacterium]